MVPAVVIRVEQDPPPKVEIHHKLLILLKEGISFEIRAVNRVKQGQVVTAEMGVSFATG